ncbi:hypothetical protein ACTXT7_009459 [Hymenolepis weldensis]
MDGGKLHIVSVKFAQEPNFNDEAIFATFSMYYASTDTPLPKECEIGQLPYRKSLFVCPILWIVLAQRWRLSSHFFLLLPLFPSDSFTLVQFTATKTEDH